jgi:hypothetical protein
MKIDIAKTCLNFQLSLLGVKPKAVSFTIVQDIKTAVTTFWFSRSKINPIDTNLEASLQYFGGICKFQLTVWLIVNSFN